MMHTIEGQPLVGSPNTNVRTIIRIISKNATKQNNNPIIEENISGAVEKAVIPSNAYLNNFQKRPFLFFPLLFLYFHSLSILF